jgi:hypothetical protein
MAAGTADDCRVGRDRAQRGSRGHEGVRGVWCDTVQSPLDKLLSDHGRRRRDRWGGPAGRACPVRGAPANSPVVSTDLTSPTAATPSTMYAPVLFDGYRSMPEWWSERDRQPRT